MLRKTTTTLTASALLLALLPFPAGAQDVDFSDEPLVIEGTRESAERMANFTRIADNAIMDYVNESTDSIQQGHRQGFSDFRDWYRTRRAEQAEREATQRMLASMIGSALGTGLNFIFPGSGVFMTLLRQASTTAYNLAVQQIGSVSEGDINAFLDRHERALQNVVTGFEDVPESLRRDHADALQAAKWEFVFEAMDREAAGQEVSSEVGPRTRRLLRDVGVPAPGSETSEVFRLRLLERQIYAVFSQDRNLRISWGDVDMRYGAEAAAKRFVYPDQPNRYCPAETQLHNFFWTAECRQWHQSFER